MPLIFEYSDKVKNRKNIVPKQIRNYSSVLYNILKNSGIPKNKLKGLKGLGTTNVYNKKGADSKKNGKEQKVKYITTNDAMIRLKRDNNGYDITKGGKPIHDFLKMCVAKSTRQEKVPKVEPPKPTSKAVEPPKAETPKVLPPVKTESRKIYISEEKLIKLNDKLV